MIKTSAWAVVDHPEFKQRLRQLKIPWELLAPFAVAEVADVKQLALILEYRGGEMQLRPLHAEHNKPLVVNFGAGKQGFRLPRSQHEQVVKAVTGRSKRSLQVVDATAGLGRDAVLLAASGHRVTAVERHPAVYTLLMDGLDRGLSQPQIAPFLQSLELKQGQAVQYLDSLPSDQRPDVVYLDPMFAEESRSSAQVKKDMQLFRALIGPDSDVDPLLQAALAQARMRVVVKRPRKAPVLPGPKPSSELVGSSSRFDVYAV